MNHSFHLSQSDLDLILSFFESNSIDISSDKNALKYLSLYVDNKSTTVCTSSTRSEIADVFELIYCLEKGYAKSKKQALGIYGSLRFYIFKCLVFFYLRACSVWYVWVSHVVSCRRVCP